MQRQHRPWIITLALAAIALAAFSLGLLVAEQRAPTGERFELTPESRDGLQQIRDAYEEILSSSVDPPDEAALINGALEGMRRVESSQATVEESDVVWGAIRGMVRVLKGSQDPYAGFYSPEAYRSFQEYSSGEFSGIGVMLRPEEDLLKIVSVLPGTPAEDEGLKVGDVIRVVDGDPVEGLPLEDVIGKIKGPEGTEVVVGIERNSVEMEFTITRAAIALPNVRARILRSGDGYIRLFGFGRGAGAEVEDKLEMLLDKGADGIVLDLRDNGGGLFVEAIEVASVFIEEGDVVIYKEKGGRETSYPAEGDAFEDVPLVVLVNQGTASASEIVAGALQDHDRAELVGVRTFGKGSVQEVLPLEGSTGAIKITTAAYFTPEGRNIDGAGLAPDIEADGGTYSQMRVALEALADVSATE